MPNADTLSRFIDKVEANMHAEACEEFYAFDASMQENQDFPRVGRDGHIALEREVLARAKSVSSQCVRPVFVHGDYVVIRWRFRFEWRNGTETVIEELAYQVWAGERITAETFFYDPAQRTPRVIVP